MQSQRCPPKRHFYFLKVCCINRQQCGDGQSEVGRELGEVGKGGEMGTSVIVSSIKIKLKHGAMLSLIPCHNFKLQ